LIETLIKGVAENHAPNHVLQLPSPVRFNQNIDPYQLHRTTGRQTVNLVCYLKQNQQILKIRFEHFADSDGHYVTIKPFTVRYRVEHSKINFTSPHTHVLFSIKKRKKPRKTKNLAEIVDLFFCEGALKDIRDVGCDKRLATYKL
jgi:hypothetical protein